VIGCSATPDPSVPPRIHQQRVSEKHERRRARALQKAGFRHIEVIYAVTALCGSLFSALVTVTSINQLVRRQESRPDVQRVDTIVV
jgi:hypothetical protein